MAFIFFEFNNPTQYLSIVSCTCAQINCTKNNKLIIKSVFSDWQSSEKKSTLKRFHFQKRFQNVFDMRYCRRHLYTKTLCAVQVDIFGIAFMCVHMIFDFTLVRAPKPIPIHWTGVFIEIGRLYAVSKRFERETVCFCTKRMRPVRVNFLSRQE